MQNPNFTPSLLSNSNNNQVNNDDDATVRANKFLHSSIYDDSTMTLVQHQQQQQQPQPQPQQHHTVEDVDSGGEIFVLRSVVPRIALPILMDEKISKFFSKNTNFSLTVENQASQLPYLIIEMQLDKSRIIPIAIFLNKIINGKPIAPYLSEIYIREVPKNFIYQSKILIPVEFFNEVIVRNEELNKLVRLTLISISILPDCDEILIRVSPNLLKDFFAVILFEIGTRFESIVKFNQFYYKNSQFKKFYKGTNEELFKNEIVLKSYFCGSLFRNFANFKYTLRTKSDCNLKIQRIYQNTNNEKSKNDDILFIVYGPYQHNVEFAIKMIENYTKKYAHLKLNQDLDNRD